MIHRWTDDTFDLDRALRAGDPLPPGVSVAFMASADSVEVGTAASDFDFLDGRWMDARVTPDISRLFPETVVCIENAEINFRGAVRLADGTRISSSFFNTRPNDWNVVDRSKVSHISGEHSSIVQGAKGFGHWLIQRVGRLFTAHDFAPQLPLISSVLPHRGDDFYSRTGFDPSRVVKLNRQTQESWIVERLFISSYSGMNGGRVADASRYRRDMARLVADVDLTQGMPAYPERVFLGRRAESSSRQGIRNGLEIEQIFLEDGYEFIDPAQLSFDEQVRLIRSARVIAGEGGSFAQNAMYGAPGLTVVVVNANSGPGKAHYTLGRKTYGRMATDALGLHYRRINASSHARYPGWLADPEIVRNALAEMPEQ